MYRIPALAPLFTGSSRGGSLSRRTYTWDNGIGTGIWQTAPAVWYFVEKILVSSVTILLQRWRDGDKSALDELIALVYAELHRMAQSYLRRNHPEQTLQPTALINEAYLKLFQNAPRFEDRAHFFAMMSRVMRQVLVDHARSAAAEKRGGREQRVPWDTAIELESNGVPRRLMVLELNRALESLSSESPALAEVVEMHYFGGMTAEEVALVLGRSAHVIRHDIRFARAWLRRELSA